MKKRTFPSLLLASVLALSACGGDDGGSATGNDSQAGAGEPQRGGS